MIVVQSGVPRPKLIPVPPPPPPRKYPLADLEVDDFFFVPGGTSRQLNAYVARVQRTLPGRKFSVRHVWMTQDSSTGNWYLEAPGQGTEGAGVWRIEP